jgi:peptidoglycan hydrolase CwlO-like protein
MNFNKVIAKANQIINNKRSNPTEMNLGAAIMSGEGMKRQRNNRNAVIANLQAQLARAQAALVESTQAANAAARNARNARNASNAQAAKNAANEAIAKVKRQERALKQLQTNASLAGVSPNQGLRKSKRQK